MAKIKKSYKERTWLFKVFFKKGYPDGGVLREGWGVLALLFAAILIVALLVGGINSVYQFSEHRQCIALEGFGEAPDYHWDYWTGCRVQTAEGYWIDADSPRLQEVTGDLDLGDN